MSPAVRVLLTLEVLEPRCTLRLRTKMRGFEAHSVETELRTYLKTRASRERAATQHPIPSLVSRYGPDVEQCQERNWKERGTVGVVGYPFFLLPQPPTVRHDEPDPYMREREKTVVMDQTAPRQPRTSGTGPGGILVKFPYVQRSITSYVVAASET